MNQLPEASYRYLGKVLVKGRKQSMKIYEFFGGDDPESAALKQQTRELFNTAMTHYYATEFKNAIESWKHILTLNPDDDVSRHFVAKTTQLLLQNIPQNWDGVERMMSK